MLKSERKLYFLPLIKQFLGGQSFLNLFIVLLKLSNISFLLLASQS